MSSAKTWAARQRLAFEILSDAKLKNLLHQTCGPQRRGMTRLDRIALMINDGFIEQVCDPIANLSAKAADVRDFYMRRLN